MRTLFLALATSATVFASSVTEIAAGDYRYCIQGEYLPGSATIVASPVTSNVRPHRLLRSRSSISESSSQQIRRASVITQWEWVNAG